MIEQCGVWNVECGVIEQCGVWNVECGVIEQWSVISAGRARTPFIVILSEAKNPDPQVIAVKNRFFSRFAPSE